MQRTLPELTEYRLRRLRLRIPLDVLAVRAGIPAANLSRFERNEKLLPPDQLASLDSTLREAEAVGSPATAPGAATDRRRA
jgi:hypothetical protein